MLVVAATVIIVVSQRRSPLSLLRHCCEGLRERSSLYCKGGLVPASESARPDLARLRFCASPPPLVQHLIALSRHHRCHATRQSIPLSIQPKQVANPPRPKPAPTDQDASTSRRRKTPVSMAVRAMRIAYCPSLSVSTLIILSYDAALLASTFCISPFWP
jgi:hypothetical protein